MFSECQHAVVADVSLLTKCFSELLLHLSLAVQQINLRLLLR